MGSARRTVVSLAWLVCAVLSQGCTPDDAADPAGSAGAAGVSAASGGGAGAAGEGPGGAAGVWMGVGDPYAGCAVVGRICRPAAGRDSTIGYRGPGNCDEGDLCAVRAGEDKGNCVRGCVEGGGEGGAGGAGGEGGAPGEAGAAGAGGEPINPGAGCIKTGPRCYPAEGRDINEPYLGPGECPAGQLCAAFAGSPKGDCVRDCGGGGGGGAGGDGGAGGASGATGGPDLALCDEPKSPCTRPADTALSAPYSGAVGGDGCEPNARCLVSVGENMGQCEAQGCTETKGDPALPAQLSGTATCNAPYELSFEGLPGEVYRFGATHTVPPDAPGGVNTGAVLLLDGVAVQEGGVDVGYYGAPIPSEPLVAEAWYNAKAAGTYTARFFSEQCAVIGINGFVERVHEAALNPTRETARALSVGDIHGGAIGCVEERWYVISASAGQTVRVTLSGKALQPGTGGGAQAALFDASLQPVSDSAGGIAVFADFTDGAPVPASQDVTLATAGLYYIKLFFWNGCAISTYQLSLASP